MDFNKKAIARSLPETVDGPKVLAKTIHDPGPDRLSTADCEHQYRADWDSTVPYWMCQVCGDRKSITAA